MSNLTEQAQIVSQSSLNPSQGVTQIAFFNPDGTPFDFGDAEVTPAEAVADITTANGSDATTTQALANATKAKVNELLGVLRDAGLLAED